MSEYKTDLTKCYIWLGKSPGIITYKLAQRGMVQYTRYHAISPLMVGYSGSRPAAWCTVLVSPHSASTSKF